MTRQCRCPNWVLKSGFMIHHPDGSRPPTRMPDIVDCAEFGTAGLKDRSGCDYQILPDYLQGSIILMVNKYVRLASEGLFPTQKRSVMNQCPPLPMAFGGKDCHQPIHGHDDVPISFISCSARYEYLIYHHDGKPSWGIIIGYGNHSHALPFQRPSAIQTRQVVRACMDSNRTATAQDLRLSLYGSRPSMESIRKQNEIVLAREHPQGRDLNAVNPVCASVRTFP